MSYTITKTNGEIVAEIADRTINNTATSLGLIGRGAVNYGETIAENFVKLLENFANATAPLHPLAGQLWFDTTVDALKVYDGAEWLILQSAIAHGTGVAPIQVETEYGLMILAAGRIVAAVSHFEFNILPSTVTIAGEAYQLAGRFPYGIKPGITLAIDSANYKFYGDFDGVADESLHAQFANTAGYAYQVDHAYQADKLSTARLINLTGDIAGGGFFDGSASINIPTVLSATGVTQGVYTKVQVDTKGRVLFGNSINAQDVIDALGYTPAQVYGNHTITVTGDASGAGIFNFNQDTIIPVSLNPTGITPGTYNTVTVDASGRVVAGSVTGPTNVVTAVTLTGDATGYSGTGNVDVTLANSGVTAGTYTTVTVDSKGRVIAASNSALTSLTVTGDATGSTVGSNINLTLAPTGVVPGTYSAVTVDSKGRVTAGSASVSNSMAMIPSPKSVPANTWTIVAQGTMTCTPGASREAHFSGNFSPTASRGRVRFTAGGTVFFQTNDLINGQFVEQAIPHVFGIDPVSRSGPVVFTAEVNMGTSVTFSGMSFMVREL